MLEQTLCYFCEKSLTLPQFVNKVFTLLKFFLEKPQEFVSDEAIVGIYYIKDVKELRESLQYLMDNNIRTRGKLCA